jgi:tetratricopeptide (TPR) repeat protein
MTDALLNQAIACLRSGQLLEAEQLASQVLSKRRTNDTALALLSQIANARRQFDDAAAYIQRAIRSNAKRPEFHALLGEIRTTQGRFTDALAAFDRALKRNPKYTPAIAAKADAYLRMGEGERAVATLTPHLGGPGESPQVAVVMARALLRVGEPDRAAAIVEPHLDRSDQPLETQRAVWFVHGEACEKSGRHAEALASWTHGNARSISDFDVDRNETDHRALTKAFSATWLKSVPTMTHGDGRPIFIVGMLRSGSTLTEQIIDQHDRAAGGGELEYLPAIVGELLGTASGALNLDRAIATLDSARMDRAAQTYLEAISHVAPKADRIVDKQLANYLWTPLIAALFPDAAIIHCRRHPMDMCLSCFGQKLPPGTNPWAASLPSLGSFHRHYTTYMDHCHELLGDRLLEVRYESLVTGLESTVDRIMGHCGLETQPGCLRFWESKRTVLTLSQDQVRQPLYDTASGRHRAWGEVLDPLRVAIGKDVIEAYEADTSSTSSPDLPVS